MHILTITNMIPSFKKKWLGTFVKDHVLTLRRTLGVPVDVFNVKGVKSGGRNVNYLHGYFSLCKTLRNRKYDLVHSHHFYMNLLFQATPSRIPLVYTLHEGEFFQANLLRRHLIRYCALRADHVIFVNRKAYDSMALPHSTFLPCGVDLQRFRILPERGKLREFLGLKEGIYYIFFPADPNRPEKNAKFAQDFIELHRDWLAERGVEFLFGGHIKHHDMPKWMNAVDLLVSFSDFESDGMVFKEAMGCNLPIVTFDIGNVSIYIPNGTVGTIIGRDHKQLRMAIEYWLDRGRSEGRAYLETLDMSLEAVSRKILSIYGDVVTRRCCEQTLKKNNAEVS